MEPPRRKHWHGSSRTRPRGYARLRERLLSEEPLCRLCALAGMVSAGAHLDHVVPLAAGGSDDPANLMPLCAPCHERKSLHEKGYSGRRHCGHGFLADRCPLCPPACGWAALAGRGELPDWLAAIEGILADGPRGSR